MEPEDLCQPWRMTKRIHRGNMASVRRVRSHLSQVLALSLRGNQSQAEAYTAQLLRAPHQVALDVGAWTSAPLFLPEQDPLYKQTCRGTKEGLEVMAAYTEALRKLRTVQSNPEKVEAKGGGKGDEDKDN